MIKKTLLVLLGILVVTPVMAKEFVYQGKIDGMSCAFCVYNVSKNIRTVPGVDADSVKVDLTSGLLKLRSNAKIESNVIAKLVTAAGFKLSNFKSVKVYKSVTYKKTALLAVKLDSLDLKAYDALLEKLGDIAAAQVGKLVIRAPRSVELPLLKAMIAARQKVAQVKFIESKTQSIEISIYQKQ